VATFANNNNNEELVATDTLAFYNEELVAATLAVYYEELDAVATNLAAPKNNCDKSKMTAVEGYRVKAEIKEYDMEQRKADATVTTAGIHGQLN
jgi:hypothetical protein